MLDGPSLCAHTPLPPVSYRPLRFDFILRADGMWDGDLHLRFLGDLSVRIPKVIWGGSLLMSFLRHAFCAAK